MIEKSFGLFFYLKQSKNQNGKSRYIYLRITIDGKKSTLSLMREWYSYRWSQPAGRAIGNKEDARELNHFLESIVSSVYRAKRELLDNAPPER